jgi:hypothetical protein
MAGADHEDIAPIGVTATCPAHLVVVVEDAVTETNFIETVRAVIAIAPFSGCHSGSITRVADDLSAPVEQRPAAQKLIAVS